MDSALTTAIQEGSLAAVQAAVDCASQEELDLALVHCVHAQNDAMFDCLLPRARQAWFDYYALRTAADLGYRHALVQLLPAVSQRILVSTLIDVLPKAPADVALALAARLEPGPAIGDALALAAQSSGRAQVAALVPFASPAELEQVLFNVAGVRPEVSDVIARALGDVTPVIERLISSYLRDHYGALPSTNLAAADSLLPFLPPEQALRVISQHAELRECPAALVIQHAAALETAIPQGRSGPVPRM